MTGRTASKSPICEQALSRGRDFAGFANRLMAAGGRMVPFFVQIKCQLGKSYEVANKLADAELASEIYSTAGDFDLLVKFYVEQGTRTIITFKAFGGS